MMRAIFGWQEHDRLIKEFFADTKSGFFVDVGAASPVAQSQSWQFEQAGWSGVLIEPRPEFAEKLRQQRRATVYEVACSAPDNAGRKMPLNLSGGHSSLNDQLVIAGLRPQGSVLVPVRTLDDILTEQKVTGPIDLVSIDVEGHEIEVLKGFDLDRWRPRLMLVEDHVLDLRLHRLMQQRGYKWVRRTDFNGWYVPADFPMRVGWFGWLQFLRKYHLSMPVRRVRDWSRRLRTYFNWRPPRRND